MSNEREALLPCPFCGGADIRFDCHHGAGMGMWHDSKDVWSMCCYDCGATFPNIPGAVGPTYTIRLEDAGKIIQPRFIGITGGSMSDSVKPPSQFINGRIVGGCSMHATHNPSVCEERRRVGLSCGVARVVDCCKVRPDTDVVECSACGKQAFMSCNFDEDMA